MDTSLEQLDAPGQYSRDICVVYILQLQTSSIRL